MAENRAPTLEELNGVKQDTVQWPAKAHRTTLTDSDGDEITDSNRLPVDALIASGSKPISIPCVG